MTNNYHFAQKVEYFYFFVIFRKERLAFVGISLDNIIKEVSCYTKMSCCLRELVFTVCDQDRNIPACSSTEASYMYHTI